MKTKTKMAQTTKHSYNSKASSITYILEQLKLINRCKDNAMIAAMIITPAATATMSQFQQMDEETKGITINDL